MVLAMFAGVAVRGVRRWAAGTGMGGCGRSITARGD
jgi:hypothetical protein